MASHSEPTCFLCDKSIRPRDMVDTRNGYFWHADCKAEARQCDCCDAIVHKDDMAMTIVCGIETWSCEECREANGQFGVGA